MKMIQNDYNKNYPLNESARYMKLVIFLLSFFALFIISGCSTVDIKSTDIIDVTQVHDDIPEAELLDVGIRIFDPGLDNIDQLEDDELVFPEIRIAETSYFPYLLMEALQSSSAWGAVRVVPAKHDSVDVLVKGHIVRSDGEHMVVNIKVSDSSGRQWFSQSYSHKTSRYAYDQKGLYKNDPFQNIYHLIANDLIKYRQQLSSEQLISLRAISELKFARSFAPQVFSAHLNQDETGIYQINRLPAENDPMLEKVRTIRDRDYLFIDTLQAYYGNYAKEMKSPYLQWRRESYNEVLAMRNMTKRARNQKMAGAAALIAGILGAGNANGSVRAASVIAVSGGAYVIKAGFDRESEAQIHLDALQELGDSLEASIESHIIELEDRTVTLTGTVENQYQQWRDILKEIYQVNTGTE